MRHSRPFTCACHFGRLDVSGRRSNLDHLEVSRNPARVTLRNTFSSPGLNRVRIRIALKFGLLITLGIIAWVVVTHLLVPNPRSPVHSLGAGIFFNLLHIAGIYLALSTAKNEAAGALVFKEGVKTGLATALVYAVSASLFFVVAIAAVGPKLMASEPGAENLSVTQVALGAFFGLFVGTLVFGLIYSTVISFFLAKRQRA